MRKRTRKEMVTIGSEKKGQEPLKFEKGGLHRSLGIPKDKKIPKAMVSKAAKGGYGKKAKKQALFYLGVLKKGQKTARKK